MWFSFILRHYSGFLPEHLTRNRMRITTVATENQISFVINLLKPRDYFTYTRFDTQNFYMVLTLRLCVLYGSQNKQRRLSYTALV